MRMRLRDIRRDAKKFDCSIRDSLQCWWDEVPWKRRSWWHELLLDPGQGWLRWSLETRTWYGGYYDPPEPYVVAPPMRRGWEHLRLWYWKDLGLKDKERMSG